MAAIARVRQLAECLAEVLAALGVDRLAQIRKRRLALVLDELRKWNALEYGKELRCVAKSFVAYAPVRNRRAASSSLCRHRQA
jgi:hypothetical protein